MYIPVWPLGLGGPTELFILSIYFSIFCVWCMIYISIYPLPLVCISITSWSGWPNGIFHPSPLHIFSCNLYILYIPSSSYVYISICQYDLLVQPTQRNCLSFSSLYNSILYIHPVDPVYISICLYIPVWPLGPADPTELSEGDPPFSHPGSTHWGWQLKIILLFARQTCFHSTPPTGGVESTSWNSVCLSVITSTFPI